MSRGRRACKNTSMSEARGENEARKPAPRGRLLHGGAALLSGVAYAFLIVDLGSRMEGIGDGFDRQTSGLLFALFCGAFVLGVVGLVLERGRRLATFALGLVLWLVVFLGTIATGVPGRILRASVERRCEAGGNHACWAMANARRRESPAEADRFLVRACKLGHTFSCLDLFHRGPGPLDAELCPPLRQHCEQQPAAQVCEQLSPRCP